MDGGGPIPAIPGGGIAGGGSGMPPMPMAGGWPIGGGMGGGGMGTAGAEKPGGAPGGGGSGAAGTCRGPPAVAHDTWQPDRTARRSHRKRGEVQLCLLRRPLVLVIRVSPSKRRQVALTLDLRGGGQGPGGDVPDQPTDGYRERASPTCGACPPNAALIGSYTASDSSRVRPRLSISSRSFSSTSRLWKSEEDRLFQDNRSKAPRQARRDLFTPLQKRPLVAGQLT